ncbi:hypothetical protein BO71DRAFT_150089 [Aspergillus ellipticus CBS 707.79]|uniref:Right handed beta helix domain-containing protein n=1 Tax=Aspergillus ellipticus CBS 707.79 TaxID=1448320 RepID=A0A319CS74_9EURO|nr:hypothetical protein BO71DRAFT_150089 [Aspergillus ellipticus CBS 707.79]
MAQSPPSITRSNLNNTIFTNLNSSDTIVRSTLDNVTVARSNPRVSGKITITRCTLSASALAHIDLTRCTFTNSTVASVRAVHVDAHKSEIADARLRRCTLSNATISNGCKISRSEARDSQVVDGCSVHRGAIEQSTVRGSAVRRANLVDCDVAGCVIVRTDFKGMVLRNGVWKNGRLVGRMGEGREVEVLRKGDGVMMEVPEMLETREPTVWMKEDGEESGMSEEDDAPPPYEP